MARTTRTLRTGRRPARGSFGQWTTDTRQGPVREHHGWDAAGLAFVDGGGAGLHGTTQDMPDTDPGTVPDRRTTRRPRTTGRTGRRGGRR